MQKEPGRKRGTANWYANRKENMKRRVMIEWGVWKNISNI